MFVYTTTQFYFYIFTKKFEIYCAGFLRTIAIF